MDEDDWAEDVIRRYSRRSGIRRLYCYEDVNAKHGRLQLEFVLRGRVFFHLSLWKIPSLFEDTE